MLFTTAMYREPLMDSSESGLILNKLDSGSEGMDCISERIETVSLKTGVFIEGIFEF